MERTCVFFNDFFFKPKGRSVVKLNYYLNILTRFVYILMKTFCMKWAKKTSNKNTFPWYSVLTVEIKTDISQAENIQIVQTSFFNPTREVPSTAHTLHFLANGILDKQKYLLEQCCKNHGLYSYQLTEHGSLWWQMLQNHLSASKPRGLNLHWLSLNEKWIRYKC